MDLSRLITTRSFGQAACFFFVIRSLKQSQTPRLQRERIINVVCASSVSLRFSLLTLYIAKLCRLAMEMHAKLFLNQPVLTAATCNSGVGLCL